MARSVDTPGEVEVHGWFRKHQGPRMSAAGIGLQFHYNQVPGFHFKVEVEEELRVHILKELQRSMDRRFPRFPSTGSVWITRIDIDDIETCLWSVIQSTRMAVEQAFNLTQPLDPEAYEG
jgi:hypothetical protein